MYSSVSLTCLCSSSISIAMDIIREVNKELNIASDAGFSLPLGFHKDMHSKLTNGEVFVSAFLVAFLFRLFIARLLFTDMTFFGTAKWLVGFPIAIVVLYQLHCALTQQNRRAPDPWLLEIMRLAVLLYIGVLFSTLLHFHWFVWFWALGKLRDACMLPCCFDFLLIKCLFGLWSCWKKQKLDRILPVSLWELLHLSWTSLVNIRRASFTKFHGPWAIFLFMGFVYV